MSMDALESSEPVVIKIATVKFPHKIIALKYYEQETPIRNLIEKNSGEDYRLTIDEKAEFARNVNMDDSRGTLNSVSSKLAYMRKFFGGYVPFNIVLSDADLVSKEQVIGETCHEVSDMHFERLPAYFTNIFRECLARPLSYVEFMGRVKHTLYSVFRKTNSEFRKGLESANLAPHVEKLRIRCVEQKNGIKIRLLDALGEFSDKYSSCKNLQWKFLIYSFSFDDEHQNVEGFKKIHLEYDYFEQSLDKLKKLADKIISLLHTYLDVKTELDSALKKNSF